MDLSALSAVFRLMNLVMPSMPSLICLKSPRPGVAKVFEEHGTLAQGSGSRCDARGLCQHVATFVDEKGFSDLDVSRICCNESVKIT